MNGGIIPLANTIFLWQSLLAVAVEIVVVAVLIWFIVPTGSRIRTAADLGIDLRDRGDRGAGASRRCRPPTRTPGEWLEHQWWVNAIVVLLGGDLPRAVGDGAESLASAITLDRLNLFFLTLGFALHRTPARLMHAFRDSVPPTWGVILQFPVLWRHRRDHYRHPPQREDRRRLHRNRDTDTFPALIAAYSAVLGVFVPPAEQVGPRSAIRACRRRTTSSPSGLDGRGV